MTVAATLWKLPGPSGFVREIRRSAARSQHVAAVLPRRHFVDNDFVETLVAEIEGPRGEIESLTPEATAGDLVQAVAAGAYLDDPPVTVRTLLTHHQVVGRTFVCAASELPPQHQEEIPEFLRRLEASSRTVPSHERGTFILIANRKHLPQPAGTDSSEVGLVSIWYWNRIARWDVAALLAMQDRADRGESLLAEIRMETVIQAARWDLDLALEIANSWSGDPAALVEHLSGNPRHVISDLGPYRREHSKHPPAAVLELWDEGIVDFWHDAITVAPAHRGLDSAGIDRLIWDAEARVLLPWIELKRDKLARQVEAEMGTGRFAEAVRQFRDPKYDDGNEGVVEIGFLAALIGAVMGKTRPRFSDTAHTLRRARNNLAHLTPMREPEVRSLIDKCRWLV